MKWNKTLRLTLLLLLWSYVLLHAQNIDKKRAVPFPHSVDLISLDKKIINSNTFTNNGKPIIITFWLTTCKPCIKEQTAINSRLNKWRIETGVRVIAISFDTIKKLEIVQKIAKQYNWKHEIYIDKRKLLRKKMLGNWFGVPQLFVFDKNMNIVQHNYGYKKEDIKRIETLLKKLVFEK